MYIRLAQRSDAALIADILYRSFYQTFRNDKNEISLRSYLDTLNEDAIMRMMDEELTRFFLCDDNRRTLGFIQLVSERPYADQAIKALKIERLYVDPDFLSKGVGSKLMSKALDIAVEEDYDTVWLLVLRSNHKGVGFYEKLGFESFDTSPGKFEEDREIDLWMKRDIP